MNPEAEPECNRQLSGREVREIASFMVFIVWV